MDVIYDAVSDYLQSMILVGNVDVRQLTEFDRLYCLMVFFQVSFYRDSITYKCPHCAVEAVYNYNLARYLAKIPDAWVDDQTVDIPYKGRTYRFRLGWPSVNTMSLLNRHFYNDLGDITEEMERTQFGIHYILSFVKRIEVLNLSGGMDVEIDLDKLDSFKDRLDCLNEMPSVVMFDEERGVFSKVTGMFVNRLENCFGFEECPQCHKETEFGLPQSVLFYSMFYGMLRSLYGFVLQVECLCLWRYGDAIFDKERFLTYNDLQTLVKQLQATEEKDAKEKQNIGRDNFTKGLWYIREILNTMVFPEDRKKGR